MWMLAASGLSLGETRYYYGHSLYHATFSEKWPLIWKSIHHPSAVSYIYIYAMLEYAVQMCGEATSVDRPLWLRFIPYAYHFLVVYHFYSVSMASRRTIYWEIRLTFSGFGMKPGGPQTLEAISGTSKSSKRSVLSGDLTYMYALISVTIAVITFG